jgi:hypothetical protein
MCYDSAVNWWYAASSALLFLIPRGATAAEDLNAAARELARKTVALAGREPVAVTWRNLSSLGSIELGQARGVFESALRDAGARASEIAPVAEGQITLSESASDYLMVEEIRKAEDRQVFIASWKRTGPAHAPSSGTTLEKKLLWEQDEPILDLAAMADSMLVLSPSRVISLAKQNGQWSQAGSASLPVKSGPRDIRGRLRLNGAALQVSLPGMACRGTLQPFTLDCQPSGDPWLLESGSRAMLLATFTANRNYFDGHITTQAGVRKIIAPFFSAASVEEQGRPIWLLAMLDGRTQIFDAAFEPAASVPAWGSDIAGTEARCGGGTQVLATRPGDGTEGDTLQAFSIVNRSPVPLSAPVGFPGPVTALWPAGGASAIAVARDLTTGKHAAYIVTVACGF